MSKIALITGANRGIGRATALSLAADGVDLILTHRDDAGSTVTEVTALGRTAVSLPLHVGALDGYDGFVDRVRQALKENWDRDSFDFLVNNAGIGLGAPFADTTVYAFDQLMNVHFRGVYFLIQRLLPVLADGGRIVNLSTSLTEFASENFSAYAAMKGAVEVLTRHLAKDLGARGITVNTVAPGPIGTDFGGGLMRDAAIRQMIAQQTALGRIGEPEDVGGAIAMLLRDQTGWITGQRIEVSGGTGM